MAELSKTGRPPATIGTLSAVVCAVAIGLSGCGSEQTGEFQSYGQGETPAVPAAGADQTAETPDSPDPENSVTSTIPAIVAFSQPPVVAPVPELADDPAARNALAENTTSPEQTPTPADVSNRDATQTPTVATPATDAAIPREVKILVKERLFEVEGPEDAIRVSFDDIDLLKVINMEPVTADAPDHMPKWLKDLDGKRIRIRGYMYPAFMETGLTSFLIARDTQTCCFGSEAKLYDRFLVRMRKGVTTNYLQRTPFDVVGVFRIEPVILDGELFQIYQIDDAVVIEK